MGAYNNQDQTWRFIGSSAAPKVPELPKAPGAPQDLSSEVVRQAATFERNRQLAGKGRKSTFTTGQDVYGAGGGILLGGSK